jgi:hypothetical protein
MDREKAIDRIKKCLALSKSSNEHEAAAALRQAQKLMLAHGITDDEIDGTLIVSDFVDHDDYEWSLRKPLIIVSVIRLMKDAFAVEGVFERSPQGTHRVRYFGQQANVMLSTHAHTVVHRAAGSSWKAYLKEHPEVRGRRNARASFVMGWCDAVADKVAHISPDPDALDRIARKKIEHYGPDGTSKCATGTKSVFTNVKEDGSEKGRAFDIHRPVNTTRRYLEDKR